MRVREAYVNANQGADWPKAQAWNISRLWFESSDPKSAVSLTNKGHVGVKMNGASSAVAAAMDGYLTRYGFPASTSPGSCGAMFDPEPFHAADVVELLNAWRKLRPTRYTVITIPPWQGGLFTPELAWLINNDPNVLLAVQAYMDYNGDQLYPADGAQALDELANLPNGCAILRQRMGLFLPVKSYAGVGVEVPYGWAGWLWTFDALPPTPPAPL